MPRRTFEQRVAEKNPAYLEARGLHRLFEDIKASGGIPLVFPPPDPKHMLQKEKMDSMLRVGEQVKEAGQLFFDGTVPSYAGIYFHKAQNKLRESFHSFAPKNLLKKRVHIEGPLFTDLDIFMPYVDTILTAGVFSKLVTLEAIIEYGENEEEIRRVISHYGIVHRVEELELEYEDVENGNLLEWYEKITEYVETDSVEETKEWLDRAIAIEYPIYLSEHLSFMVDKELDFDIYADMLSLLVKHDFINNIKSIEPIFWADVSLEEKSELMGKVAAQRRLLEFLHLDSLDVDDWVKRATEKGEAYLNKEFGLTEKYSLAVNIRVQDVVNGSTGGDVLRQVLQLEEKGGYNLALFERGKLHVHKKTQLIDNGLDPTDATRLLVYGLLGRLKERVVLAKQAYDLRTLSVARRYIEKSHAAPKQLFSLIKGDFEILEGDFLYETKLDSARSIIETLREVYFFNTEYNPEKFQLLNLVRSVEGLSGHTDSFDELVSQMQEYRLMDMFGGTRLMCCAFLSEDRERKEAEAVLYQADPYIGLEQIVPYKDGVRVGEPIGVSILANCETKDNCSVLLVDSAEGGSILQGISKRVYLPLFLEGIIGSAEDSGSEMIFVPQKAVNGIAKQFRDYFKSVVGQSKPENRYLSKLRGDGGLVIPQEKRFLEAFEDREKLSEEISGYCVRVEELKLMQF